MGAGIPGTVLDSTGTSMTRGELSSSLVATAAPAKPQISQGDAASTATSVSVKISLPSDGSTSLYNGTEVYRNGTLIATLQKNVLNWTSTGLQPGTLYIFHAVLTTSETRLRVVSDSSDSLELWTALPAPQLAIDGTTPVPSVTVNVPLPPGLESTVVMTVCWETSSPDFTFFVLNEQFFVSSAPGDTGYTVDWATTYVWKCVFEGLGGTTSASGLVSVTLPPKAPIITMRAVYSAAINVTVDIENHAASKALATDYQLTCNDTNTARTVAIVLSGPSLVTLAGLQPMTTYACWAKVSSSAGDSRNSKTASAITDNLPEPTVRTTAVNATAVWVEVTLPELQAQVKVSGVRISRAMSNATAGGAWATVVTISTADTDGKYRHVDGGRASQTEYWYKAVYLTPSASKESATTMARTGPPAAILSLNYMKAYEVAVNLVQTGLSTQLVSGTYIRRSGTLVCSSATGMIASCLDNTEAISPGVTYEYTAQYEGRVFYEGQERNEQGLISAPLSLTTPLVAKPVISYQKITATTAEICVTYPADGSHKEIVTTEFSRVYQPTSTVSTFRITKVNVTKDCVTRTGLEPATTSSLTAYYTTTGANSLVSDVLQVTQARPAAPSLSVGFVAAYENATTVKIQLQYPNLPSTPSMQTDPPENLLAVVKRIDLYRDGYLVEYILDPSSNSYVFTDAGLPPGLTFGYWSFLFTTYAQSDNGSVSATTAVAEAPTVAASGIDATSVKVTVAKPVPEQAAAVAIRIYSATASAGPYTLLTSISKSSPTYEYTHSGLEAGTQYFYKADYTTAGKPNSRAGLDSKISIPDSAWTSPNPPVLSLISSTSSTAGTSTNIIRIAQSTSDSDVSKLVLERVSGGHSCIETWEYLGITGSISSDYTDTSATPATTYTYVAFYVGQENMKSTNVSITLTTPAQPPTVVKGPYPATSSFVSVEIELPLGWEKSNGDCDNQ
eukprot:tig00000269_g23724.t1